MKGIGREYLYNLQIKWGTYESMSYMKESHRFPLPAIPTKTIEDNHDLEIALNIEASN